jgi:hypothetical protein
MTASEWQAAGLVVAAAEAVELPLPSGMVIRARRPDPVQVAMWGQLPLRLASAVGGEGGGALPGNEEVLAAIALSRDVLVYCCVSPRISMTPVGDGEIHPRDVPMADAMFILKWARREEETEKLRCFRGESTDAGLGSDGEDVRGAAFGDVGDLGSDGGLGSGPGGGGETGVRVIRGR